MTSYFDNRDREVRDLSAALRASGETPEILDAIGKLEKGVIVDVTMCAEWPAKGDRPACPEVIRVAIHRCVLRFSMDGQTSHAPSAWVCPDYEDTEAQLVGLGDMLSRLHSIFHSLGRMDIEGFNDSPLTPLVHLEGDGQEAREKLTAEIRAERGRASK